MSSLPIPYQPHMQARATSHASAHGVACNNHHDRPRLALRAGLFGIRLTSLTRPRFGSALLSISPRATSRLHCYKARGTLPGCLVATSPRHIPIHQPWVRVRQDVTQAFHRIWSLLPAASYALNMARDSSDEVTKFR